MPKGPGPERPIPERTLAKHPMAGRVTGAAPRWKIPLPIRDGLSSALILAVSVAVGAIIFAYGAAVRDVCLDAGLSPWSANALALLACSPILAALYSIDA